MEYDVVEDQALEARLRKIMSLMRPMRAVNCTKKRYGKEWDGGYVILTQAERAEIVYSLGISDDCSFDEEMANYGADIYQYDHTVDGPPTTHPKFHFHKMGIANTDGWLPNMRRLDTIIKMNGHEGRSNMLLKIDIEGHEWDQYDLIDSSILGQFDQIVGEFHHFGHMRNTEWLDRTERALTKLNATHQVVHVHGNNNDDFATIAGVVIPKVIELTWARRSSYLFTPTDETFPTEIDMASTPARPDLELGTFIY